MLMSCHIQNSFLLVSKFTVKLRLVHIWTVVSVNLSSRRIFNFKGKLETIHWRAGIFHSIIILCSCEYFR